MWPQITDFSKLFRNPSVAFSDERLKACEIEFHEAGYPRAWSGGAASVFRGRLPDGQTVAIRCFMRAEPERRGRYHVVSQYLDPLHTDALVRFEYIDKGVRSVTDRQFYPLVIMPWLEGELLSTWLEACCRNGDTAAISLAARRWLAVAAELRRLNVCHGDLQHGNVLVTAAGDLRLVDYDGLSSRQLFGQRTLEKGVAAYQHPRRDDSTPVSSDLDNFSTLVILTTMLALANDPELWPTNHKVGPQDGILFDVEDFACPRTSQLLRSLAASSDSRLARMAACLAEAASGGLNDTPHLIDLWRQVSPPDATAVEGGPLAERLVGAHNIVFVLDASASAEPFWSRVVTTLHKLAAPLLDSARVQVAFLGSSQAYPLDQFMAHPDEFRNQNAGRTSLITPTYALQRETDERAIFVVLGAGSIFDMADWSDTPSLINTVFVSPDDAPLTEKPWQEYRLD